MKKSLFNLIVLISICSFSTNLRAQNKVVKLDTLIKDDCFGPGKIKLINNETEILSLTDGGTVSIYNVSNKQLLFSSWLGASRYSIIHSENSNEIYFVHRNYEEPAKLKLLTSKNGSYKIVEVGIELPFKSFNYSLDNNDLLLSGFAEGVLSFYSVRYDSISSKFTITKRKTVEQAIIPEINKRWTHIIDNIVYDSPNGYVFCYVSTTVPTEREGYEKRYSCFVSINLDNDKSGMTISPRISQPTNTDSDVRLYFNSSRDKIVIDNNSANTLLYDICSNETVDVSPKEENGSRKVEYFSNSYIACVYSNILLQQEGKKPIYFTLNGGNHFNVIHDFCVSNDGDLYVSGTLEYTGQPTNKNFLWHTKLEKTLIAKTPVNKRDCYTRSNQKANDNLDVSKSLIPKDNNSNFTESTDKNEIGKDEYPEYYDNGQVRKVGPKKDGVPHGYYKFYYEDGNLWATGNVSNGVKSGLWKSYYKDGTLSSETTFVDGIEQGPYKFYHPNGKLKVDGSYENGEKHGLWKYWNENGSYNSERKYKNGGYAVDTKKHSDDGKNCTWCKFGQYWGGSCNSCGAIAPSKN